MRTFIDDDAGYLRWAATNPRGFVVNIERSLNPNGVILHRSACWTITGTPSKGQHWTKDYIKVCSSEREVLERWMSREIGGDFRPCGICKP